MLTERRLEGFRRLCLLSPSAKFVERGRTALALSRPSAELEGFTLSPGSIRQGIAAYLYVLAAELPYWETEKIVRILANQAYRAKYKGVAELLQRLLEAPAKFSIALEIMFDWYKSYDAISPFLTKIGYQIRPYIYRFLDFRPPAIKPERKRGYDDKGSHRPQHEDHGEGERDHESYLEPLIDRRSAVSHPLLNEREAEGGLTVPDTFPQGGNNEENLFTFGGANTQFGRIERFETKSG